MSKRKYTISKVQSSNPILSGHHTPGHNTTLQVATGLLSSQPTDKELESVRFRHANE
jgi:hypothetical protein